MIVPKKGSDKFSRIRKNDDPRYHYLSKCPELEVPETILDFKHYFTLPTGILRSAYGKSEHYLARLEPLYREQVSQRFASFLARVGLPIMHKFLPHEEE